MPIHRILTRQHARGNSNGVKDPDTVDLDIDVDVDMSILVSI